MKKTITLLVCLFMICGCSKENDHEPEIEQESLISVLETMKFKKAELICPGVIDNIKDITLSSEGVNNYLLTNTNKLYEYSFDKIYSSSGNNCHEVNTGNIKIDKLGVDGVPTDADNKVYYDGDFTGKNFSFSIDRYIKDAFPLATLIEFKYGTLGFIVEENEVFYVDSSNLNKNKVYLNLSDELIFEIYYVFRDDVLVIKTDSSYYTCKEQIINKDQCNKYADVICDYSYSCKANKLTQYYDEIKIFNGYFVITSSNDIYVKNKYLNKR